MSSGGRRVGSRAPGNAPSYDPHGSRLFLGDHILPVQFDALQRSHYRKPEQKLALVMLEEAWRDVLKCVTDGKPARDKLASVDDWVDPNYDGDGLSFELCCEGIGLDVDLVRRGFQSQMRHQRRVMDGKQLAFDYDTIRRAA